MRKKSSKPCRCAAYSFPHRLNSKECRYLYNNTPDDEIDFRTLGMSRDQKAANDAGVDGRYFQ